LVDQLAVVHAIPPALATGIERQTQRSPRYYNLLRRSARRDDPRYDSWVRVVLLAALVAIGCATGGAADEPLGDAARADGRVDDTSVTLDSSAPSDTEAIDSGPVDSTPPLDTAPPDTGPTCGPGQKWCTTSCASIAIDLENCGDCGKKCPDVANADRTCVGGVCGFSCKDPFAKCGADTACTTNTTSDPANCGSCGKVCPSSATTTATCAAKTCGASCKSGYVSLAGHCTIFGGAFESNTAGCGACNNGNPYAASNCDCPAGTVAGSAFALHNDCSGVRPATMQMCEASGAVAGVWGGAFQRDDTTACATACRVSNAKTGGCSCPAGYSELALRVLARSTCSTTIGSHIVACVHPSLGLDNFGGVYQVDDPVPSSLGCRTANPRTGACTCPSGFSASAYRTIVDVPGGMIGSVINFCSR
jgi:hypothetical protein